MTSYKVYEDELNDLTYRPTSFLDRILHVASRRFSHSTDMTYSFSVYASDYIRAELLCQDISEELEDTFTQSELISLLVDGFLYEAKHKMKPKEIYEGFNSKIERSIQIHDLYGGSEIITLNKKQSKKAEITCVIKRNEALRLEVILCDIADLGIDHNYTVNDILEILYSDFIYKYRTGELYNILNTIVTGLKKQKGN